MSQQVRFLKQGTVEFETNGIVAKSLSRGTVYRELHLRLTGAPTLSAANNTAAKLKRGDEWACIKRIELILNNSDVIRSFSGNDLWWINYFMFGAAPPVTTGLGDASTANAPFDSTLILPFWMPGTIRPLDTALDARILSDLKVQVTWGTYTDINADASAWTTEPKLYVSSINSFNVSGPFAQWRSSVIEKEITASNSQFQVQLPVGPVYRGFFLNFTDAGVDDGDILNNFKLISGSTVFADRGERELEQAETLRSKDPYTYDSGAGGYDKLRRSTSSKKDGWYFHDHVTDGYLSEAIDTLGFSEFTLDLDVTVGSGTTKCSVIPIQIYPVRSKR